MGCMRPISENAVICPHCSYNAASKQLLPFLKKGTVLDEKYIVGKVLGTFSDSASYIAYDYTSNRVLKIVEFLPERLTTRQENTCEITVKEEHRELYAQCLSSFVSLWNCVGEIGNPLAVDEVYDVFTMNNTAYAICEYTRGITLRDYFDEHRTPLSWSEAYSAFLPIMSAVSKLHKLGTVHAEISPATVYVTQDGRFRLSGFAVPQSHGNFAEINQLPIGGYAPIERYKDPSLVCAATDVYSLACLFYTAVTGLVPPNAQRRITEKDLELPLQIKSRISAEAVIAFGNAVEVFPSSRTKSVDELISAFACKEIKPQEFTGYKEEPVYLNFENAPKPEAVPPAIHTQNETKPQPKEEKDASTVSIIVKSFFSVLIIAAIIFTTLYTTVLYKSLHIPFYDTVFGSLSFLPMNIDNSEQEQETESRPEETTEAELVSVADFTKLSYEYIKQNAIFAQNYDLVYEFEYSDTYKKNEIIMQSIPAGEDVPLGTTIIIYVSRGNRSVVLRDVIGMDYNDAYELLTQDGFVVKKRNLRNDGAQKTNEVYTMSLVAGLEFEYGTEVILSVWASPTGTSQESEG